MAINGVSGSALSIGLQGFQAAQTRANEAAQNIASQSITDASTESINTNDLVTSLVDLKAAEIDAQANAKVVETASDILGTLLDIEA